jgi:hypothetical protein
MRAINTAFVLRLVLVALLTARATAAAQDPHGFPLADNQLWEFGVWGGEAIGGTAEPSTGVTQITMAGFHMARVIYDATKAGHTGTLEYTVELQPLFLITSHKTAYGGGFSPLGVKWNFAPRPRYRPYVEFNGGAMVTQKNVPPGRTSSFNFTIGLGPGVMIALHGNQVLSIGLRYWHLSNANMGTSNPAFNGVQIVVGYHWLKARRPSQQQVSTTAGTTQTKP